MSGESRGIKKSVLSKNIESSPTRRLTTSPCRSGRCLAIALLWDEVPPPLKTSSAQRTQQSVRQGGAHPADVTGHPKQLSHSSRARGAISITRDPGHCQLQWASVYYLRGKGEGKAFKQGRRGASAAKLMVGC